METDVLTTSQAARLLGISVRTAQLLVEGGSLRSWKTPGGHRRVYRDDVLALMKASGPVSAPSPANAILLASPARMPLYERLRSEIGDIAIEIHSDEHAAAFAIGARLPAAVIVDLSDQSAARLSFARHLSSPPLSPSPANPVLAPCSRPALKWKPRSVGGRGPKGLLW